MPLTFDVIVPEPKPVFMTLKLKSWASAPLAKTISAIRRAAKPGVILLVNEDDWMDGLCILDIVLLRLFSLDALRGREDPIYLWRSQFFDYVTSEREERTVSLLDRASSRKHVEPCG
jgi:hypothetical protein